MKLVFVVVGDAHDGWIYRPMVDLAIPEDVLLVHFGSSSEEIPALLQQMHRNHLIEFPHPTHPRIQINIESSPFQVCLIRANVILIQ